MLERDLSKSIRIALDGYQMCGEVEWWMRINSGSIKSVYGGYLKLAPEGTPDFIAVIRNKEGGLSVVFVEAKGQTGQLRPSQVVFSEKYNKKKDIYVIKVSDVKELHKFINEIALDTTENIKL